MSYPSRGRGRGFNDPAAPVHGGYRKTVSKMAKASTFLFSLVGGDAPSQLVGALPYNGEAARTFGGLQVRQLVVRETPRPPHDAATALAAAARGAYALLPPDAKTRCKWKAQQGIFTVANCSCPTLGEAEHFMNQNKGCSFQASNFLVLPPSVASSALATAAHEEALECIADLLAQQLGGRRTEQCTERKRITKWKEGPNEMIVTLSADATRARQSQVAMRVPRHHDEQVISNLVALPTVPANVREEDIPVTFRFQVKDFAGASTQEMLSVTASFDEHGTPISLLPTNGSPTTYTRYQHSIGIQLPGAHCPVIASVSMYVEKKFNDPPESSIRVELHVKDEDAVASEAAWVDMFLATYRTASLLAELPRSTSTRKDSVFFQQPCSFEAKHGACWWARCGFRHAATQCPQEMTSAGCSSLPSTATRGGGGCGYRHFIAEAERLLQDVFAEAEGVEGPPPAVPRGGMLAATPECMRGMVQAEFGYQLQRIICEAEAYNAWQLHGDNPASDATLSGGPASAMDTSTTLTVVQSPANRAGIAAAKRDSLRRAVAQLSIFTTLVAHAAPRGPQETPDEALRRHTRLAARMCSKLKAHLPALARAQDIRAWASSSSGTGSRFLVVKGATGSGKSTQIPQYLADEAEQEAVREGLPRAKVVYCTQPRSIAALSLAQRVSDEYGGLRRGAPLYELGSLVGYIGGGKKLVSHRCRIVFLTERAMLAILSRSELQDPFAVFVDEAHERSVVGDMLIGLLKLRTNLRVVVGSATVDTALFQKYFASCRFIEISGRTFPIDVRYRPPAEYSLFTSLAEPDASDYVQAAAREVFLLLADEGSDGRENQDILCFMPSADDCEEAQATLKRLTAAKDKQQQKQSVDSVSPPVVVMLLSGRQTVDEQQAAFQPLPQRGSRKVIFATAVAETSVTIHGVGYVVDTGLVRTSRYNQRRNDTELVVVPISRSAAEQRAGRAGRTAPGVCIRLYAASDLQCMATDKPCELLQSPLHMPYLQLSNYTARQRSGAGPPAAFSMATFPWIEAPDAAVVAHTRQGLRELDAIDADDSITPFGAAAVQLELPNIAVAKLLFLAATHHPGEARVWDSCATVVSVILNAPSIFFRVAQADLPTADKQRQADGARFGADAHGDLVTLSALVTEFRSVISEDAKRREDDGPAKRARIAKAAKGANPGNATLASTASPISGRPSADLPDALLAVQTQEGADAMLAADGQPNAPPREELTADNEAIDDSPVGNDGDDEDEEEVDAAATVGATEDENAATATGRKGGVERPSDWCAAHFLRQKGMRIISARAQDILRRMQGSFGARRTTTSTTANASFSNHTVVGWLVQLFSTQIAIRRDDRNGRYGTLTGDVHDCFTPRSSYATGNNTRYPDVLLYTSLLRSTCRNIISLVTPLTETTRQEMLSPDMLASVNAALAQKLERVAIPVHTAFFTTYRERELAVLLVQHCSLAAAAAAPRSAPSVAMNVAENVLHLTCTREQQSTCTQHLASLIADDKMRAARSVQEIPVQGLCRVALGRGGRGGVLLPDDTTFLCVRVVLASQTDTPVTTVLTLLAREGFDAASDVVAVKPLLRCDPHQPCVVVTFATTGAAKRAEAAFSPEKKVVGVHACRRLIETGPLGDNGEQSAGGNASSIKLQIWVGAHDPEDPASHTLPSDCAITAVQSSLRKLFQQPSSKVSSMYDAKRGLLTVLAELPSEASVFALRSALNELRIVDGSQRLFCKATYSCRLLLPQKLHWKSLAKHMSQLMNDACHSVQPKRGKQERRVSCSVDTSNDLHFLVLESDSQAALAAASATARNSMLQVHRLPIGTSPGDAYFFTCKAIWEVLKRSDVRQTHGIDTSRFIVDYDTSTLVFLGPDTDKSKAVDIINDALNEIKKALSYLKCDVLPRGRGAVRQWMADLRHSDDMAKARLIRGVLEVVCRAADVTRFLEAHRLCLSSINGTPTTAAAGSRSAFASHAETTGGDDDDGCMLCGDALLEPFRLSTCCHSFCRACIAPMLKSETVTVPVTCPQCADGTELAAQDIVSLDQQQGVPLGETSVTNYFPPSTATTATTTTYACFEKCPRMTCLGFFRVEDAKERAARCEGCQSDFCRRCIQQSGQVSAYHEGACQTADEQESRRVFSSIIQPILEKRLQCPACQAFYGGFDACFAVMCDKCRSFFCGFCLEHQKEDNHRHVADCPRNPNQGNPFADYTVFMKCRDEDAVAQLTQVLPPLRLKPNVTTAILSELASKKFLPLEQVQAVAKSLLAAAPQHPQAAEDAKGGGGSAFVAWAPDPVIDPQGDVFRCAVDAALRAVQALDPQSRFTFSAVEPRTRWTYHDALAGLAAAGILRPTGGGALQQQPPPPQDPDRAAFMLYMTNEIYASLNATLRSGLNATTFTHLQPYMFFLLRGLQTRMYKGPITVYRAINIPAEAKKEYVLHSTVLWRQLSSCSTSQAQARRFGSFVFTIRLTDFARVAEDSASSRKEEVLIIPPLTRLRVAEVNGDSVTLEQIISSVDI